MKHALHAALFCSLLVPALLSMNSDLLTKPWKARWIYVPSTSPFDYGVYHFRHAFPLASPRSSFVVHVSADNRYELYVNGTRVARGPARGDLDHWRFETVDLAPYLRAGRNVLAAVVWNDGAHTAVSQISSRTGFLLQGDTSAEAAVNTGQEWKCLADAAYSANLIAPAERTGYYAVPPGEKVDASLYPWGWQEAGYDDSAWKPAAAMDAATPRPAPFLNTRWMLVPRPIPPMEQTPQRFSRLRRTEGITPPAAFPAEPTPLTIPAHSTATLLLDQDHLTTAFPELELSGGKGARVTLGYAEGLWLQDKREKGHRDQVEGKRFLGNRDVFLADGGARRLFRPLWWRTFRYVEVKVKTVGEPLTIDDLRSVYTGYPFVRRASFDAGSGELARILDVGWRTARLCSHETYMDCPYYEQLQYAGDTRIQALVSVYMTGDTRLMRNAIEQLDSSRTAEGATFSRAPSALPQYIPPFSLWWIGMLHDYWMYAGDAAFVKQMLPGVHSVLTFFAAHQNADGSLGPLPWWNFVDWVPAWRNGVPPLRKGGASATLDLQLLLAYEWAADLEEALGSPAVAGSYRANAGQLKAAVHDLYWDNGRGLFADRPARKEFSQHASALAVLAGVVTGSQAREVMERAVADQTISQATIYFRYYLHSAMREAGLGDRYLDMLGPWRWMLSQGLTTWAEWDRPDVRSDCHAWGASPNIELFRTVLGIDSAAPGFAKVRIRPNLGQLPRVAGSIPHPRGEIRVQYELRSGRLYAHICLPGQVSGEIEWKGARQALHSGENHLVLSPL
jgi:alpha-L-rhamnosidase